MNITFNPCLSLGWREFLLAVINDIQNTVNIIQTYAFITRDLRYYDATMNSNSFVRLSSG